MIIFIDESGDPGYKVEKGSSTVFIIIMVGIKEDLEAEEISERIGKLKEEMGKSVNHEFKFNKMTKQERIKFLLKTSKFEFEIRSLILFKGEIGGNQKYIDYPFLLQRLFKENRSILRDARIRIDKIGSKRTNKEINVILRNSVTKSDGKKWIKNCKFVDSRSNNLIQLADVIAGSVHRYYAREKEDCDVYMKIIRNKMKREILIK
jgi:hypothetical protein